MSSNQQWRNTANEQKEGEIAPQIDSPFLLLMNKTLWRRQSCADVLQNTPTYTVYKVRQFVCAE